MQNGQNLDPSLIEALEKGREYELLVQEAGWTRLLKELEGDADLALAKIRGCVSNEEGVLAPLALEWKRQEQFFKELHVKVYGAIEERKAILKDLAEHSEKEEGQIEGELIMEEGVYGGRTD
jgi:hypothetical protein